MAGRAPRPGDETSETFSRTRPSPDDDEFETVAPQARSRFRDAVAPDHAVAGEYTRTSERRKKKEASKRVGKKLSLRARAVGFLSRREHSRLELARKLAPLAQESDALEPLLDALEKEGWLSNERFAQSLLHRRAPIRGTARIVAELRQSGIDDATVAELKESLRGTEYERAREVWRKRFGGEAPADRAAYAKQARFLASRGFAHDLIHKIIGDEDLS